MSEQKYIWKIVYKIGDGIRTSEERGKTKDDAVQNLSDGLSQDAIIISIECLGKAVPTGKYFQEISELI